MKKIRDAHNIALIHPAWGANLRFKKFTAIRRNNIATSARRQDNIGSKKGNSRRKWVSVQTSHIDVGSSDEISLFFLCSEFSIISRAVQTWYVSVFAYIVTCTGAPQNFQNWERAEMPENLHSSRPVSNNSLEPMLWDRGHLRLFDKYIYIKFKAQWEKSISHTQLPGKK